MCWGYQLDQRFRSKATTGMELFSDERDGLPMHRTSLFNKLARLNDGDTCTLAQLGTNATIGTGNDDLSRTRIRLTELLMGIRQQHRFSRHACAITGIQCAIWAQGY